MMLKVVFWSSEATLLRRSRDSSRTGVDAPVRPETLVKRLLSCVIAGAARRRT